MHLIKALELRTAYDGLDGTIRVNADGYINLTDMAKFFPGKRMDEWKSNKSTLELIIAVENLIPGITGIIAGRGRNGGTWAHEIIAMDFAAWLSPEFKIKIYTEYINGTQHKKNWNMKRILAAFNYKMMTDSIKNAHEEPKHYHYSNEALLLNEIVFGVREGDVRDTATEQQLDMISFLEPKNATMIDLGMDYNTRRDKLKEFYEKYLTSKMPMIK